jgi:hypothetical protein
MVLSDKARTKAKVSWYPDLAIGPDGSVHVVWCSFPQFTRPNGEAVYVDSLMYRVLRNGKWSDSNDIFSAQRHLESGIEYTVRNSIVMGLDGQLHVLLRDRAAIRAFSAPWDKAWPANAWSALYGIGGGYYTALAMDSTGILHALRTSTTLDEPGKPRKDCPGCAHLFYTHSDNGGSLWSSSVNLSKDLAGANRPQIAVDKRNRIHVVWDDGFDWYVDKGAPKTGVYRRSDDGGNTWTQPTLFSIPNDGVQQASLALTSDGNPMVVYRSVTGGKLYMQRSVDGGDTWIRPSEIPGVIALDTQGKGLDRYTLAADGSDHVHLIMVGYKAGEVREQSVPALMHLSWDGSAWSAPEEIMRSAGYLPEWPELAIAGGNRLHVVWFTRHDIPVATADADTRDYQVWYSSRLIDARAAAPSQLFTPTPAILPSATPGEARPTPTLTPLPDAIRTSPLIGGRPAWEIQGLLVILIALLPVIGFVVVLGLIMQRRTPRRQK